MNEPAAASAADVRSISSQTDFAVWVNVVIVAPFGGRLLKLIVASAQVVSSTALMLCAPTEPLVTHIRNLADRTVCPASGCRSNFMYVSRTGELSD
jgi:hypothetical protein